MRKCILITRWDKEYNINDFFTSGNNYSQFPVAFPYNRTPNIVQNITRMPALAYPNAPAPHSCCQELDVVINNMPNADDNDRYTVTAGLNMEPSHYVGNYVRVFRPVTELYDKPLATPILHIQCNDEEINAKDTVIVLDTEPVSDVFLCKDLRYPLDVQGKIVISARDPETNEIIEKEALLRLLADSGIITDGEHVFSLYVLYGTEHCTVSLERTVKFFRKTEPKWVWLPAYEKEVSMITGEEEIPNEELGVYCVFEQNENPYSDDVTCYTEYRHNTAVSRPLNGIVFEPTTYFTSDDGRYFRIEYKGAFYYVRVSQTIKGELLETPIEAVLCNDEDGGEIVSLDMKFVSGDITLYRIAGTNSAIRETSITDTQPVMIKGYVYSIPNDLTMTGQKLCDKDGQPLIVNKFTKKNPYMRCVFSDGSETGVYLNATFTALPEDENHGYISVGTYSVTLLDVAYFEWTESDLN